MREIFDGVTVGRALFRGVMEKLPQPFERRSIVSKILSDLPRGSFVPSNRVGDGIPSPGLNEVGVELRLRTKLFFYR